MLPRSLIGQVSRRAAGVALLLLVGQSAAQAEPKPAPLVTFAADKLQALAPLLKSTELTLVEENEQGTLKQLTTLTLAAAPPEVVRDVVVHPERYREFVRNTKVDLVKTEADGSLLHEYAVSYTVYTVDGRHRYVFLKEGAGGGPPSVELYDPDPNGVRHYRWEFLPATGGGTVIALYGYTQVARNGFMSGFLSRAPTLEFGFGLIPQLTMALAVKQRAEQLARAAGQQVTPPSGSPGSYEFLLERGTLALFRTGPSGRITDISLVDRTTARPDLLLQVASRPAEWSSFLPSFSRSTALPPQNGMARVELEQSLPLVKMTSTFAYRATASSVDAFAESGDLSGGRIRWDIRARPSGHSELVLRMIQQYEKGSLVIRELYKLEPLFEYGVDVGLGLVLLKGIRQRAEALSRPPPAR